MAVTIGCLQAAAGTCASAGFSERIGSRVTTNRRGQSHRSSDGANPHPRGSDRGRASDSVDSALAALPGLSRDALKERWTELYGKPPSHLGRPVMIRAIAYRIQEQIYGGLDPATLRLLDRAAQDLARGREPTAPRKPIASGTRLLREWQGVVHEVIVLERGVQFREKTWPSLSAVAREITGTRWSGPRFFGLRGNERDGR